MVRSGEQKQREKQREQSQRRRERKKWSTLHETMHSRIVALAGAILAVSPSAAVDSEHRRVTRQRKDQLRRRRQTANVDKREVNDEDAAFWAQMMKLRELQGGSLPPTPVVTPFPVSSPTISTSAPTPIVSVGDFFPTVPPESASTPTPTIIATIPFEPTVGPTGVLTPFPTGGETGEEVGPRRSAGGLA